MKILVMSCDKNIDLFEAFHHCMEKYYPTHPEIIYSTETISNPYYKTICKNYPLSQWSRRIRETLKEIDDTQILLMNDDCFIREPVDVERIKIASENLQGNIAMFNFEKSFGRDLPTSIPGFKKRPHPSSWEVSIMCGLWDSDKLIKILSVDSNPWEIESAQKTYVFDFYINSADFIINWGYHQIGNPPGLCKGKWCREVVPFFEKEGIEMDYSKRGFIK